MERSPSIVIRGYSIVLAALIVLTIITVWISFLPLSAGWHLALGLSIGVIKASLVAVFFMHLLRSPKLIWAIVAVALFWLIVVLMPLTFSDYLTRTL